MTQLMKAQLDYLERSKGKRGFAAFMEMGMGKTYAILIEYLNHGASAAIIVCPNSLKSNWADEVRKHGLPINPMVWESGDDAAIKWINRSGKLTAPMLIVNYEAIRYPKTREAIDRFLEIHLKDVFIAFDESIQISTHDAAQTKAAIAIAKECRYRRILSGKPTRSGPHDLWSQLRTIGALDGFNYYAFKVSFCKMGGFKAKQVVGTKNEEELGELIAPHVFFARKEDYLDLPDKMFTTRRYSLGPDLQKLYDSMLHEFVAYVSDEKAVAVDVAITKYEKMSQIMCGFIYDEEGKMHKLVPDEKNPRLALLLEILEEASGKVCIAYRHRPVFEMLLAALLPHYGVACITGNMSPEEITEQKRKFNEDPECRVILLQMQSARYGHTLLADQTSDVDHCSTMVMFENSYSLDDRSQIEDRIHRIGQTKSALYIDIVGTKLDADVINALQKKEAVFQTILNSVRKTAAPVE